MDRARNWLTRLYPVEREIIVRADGRIRYLRIGRAGQIVASLVLLVSVSAVVFGIDRYSAHLRIVADRDHRIASLRSSNESMSGELRTLRQRLAMQEDALGKSERLSASLHADNAAIRAEVDKLVDSIEDRDKARRDIALSRMMAVESSARLAEEVRRLERRRDELNLRLAAAEHAVETADAAREYLHREVEALRARISSSEDQVETLSRERRRLATRLEAAQADLRAAVDARRQVETARARLGRQVNDLSARLEALEVANLEVVDRLGERAKESANPLRRALQMAGLDVDRLLDRMSQGNSSIADGIGGPLVALVDEPGSGLAQKIAAVETRIEALQSMQELMERLPLAAPLDEYRVTSGFGRRVDPFTNRLALHPGMDMASREGTPVMVTAPGTVTFVGWRGGFGKMVEVDHGLGVRTRYAHLARIFVKRDQTLEFREKVGTVGSTGRSTAPHLHYEILVDGRPNDPANFMKAGQYVFKN